MPLLRKCRSTRKPANRTSIPWPPFRCRANGVGSEVSPYVAQAVEVIRESGLPQETNALFTNVEGDLDDVLKVAGEAAKKLAEQGYRTSLVLHMDIRPGFTGQLTEKPKLVDEILADKQAK